MENNNSEFTEHYRERSESSLGNKIAAAIFTGTCGLLGTYFLHPWLWLQGPLHQTLFLVSVFLTLAVSIIGCIFGLVEAVKQFTNRSDGNDFEGDCEP